MAKSKRSGNSYKNYYNEYKTREVSQRRKRLEKHLKEQPNDEQARAVLEAGPKRRRQTPKSDGGWFQESYHRPYIASVSGDKRPLNIGPGQRRKVAQTTAHSAKVARMIDHGSKQIKNLMNPSNKSNYAFVEEHEASVSKNGKNKS